MKMYNEPKTEVMDLKTASLMDSMVVSPGAPEDPNVPPIPGMPSRGGEVID